VAIAGATHAILARLLLHPQQRLSEKPMFNPDTPILELHNIRKTFRGSRGAVPVLDGLSLKVMNQDFFGIIGPSGCGKTTIFNIIAGLFEPDSGDIFFEGKPADGLRGRVGYMMQKDLLFPWRTVLQNVLLGLQVRGKPAAESKAIAREYLNTFGLTGFEDSYPKQLSGGMRQRVALIRTLIVDPDILLLDEPFAALDYQTRLYLEGVLMEAVQKYKKTVILVTHDIDEAVALANKVLVLTKRPASTKAEHAIGIEAQNPLDARSDPKFSGYFHMLCSELDIQTRRTAA
jgi:NitT/TauT family transport system ATP-binding protein